MQRFSRRDFGVRCGWLAVGLAWMAAGGEGLAQAPAPGPGFQAPRDLFAPGAVPSTPRAPDSVVVTVNGKPVLQKEVNREVDRAFAQVAAQVPAEQVAQARQQIAQRVMEGLISRQLLLIGVEQKGIQITPEEMAGVRQQIEAQVPAGQSFETLLAAQGITRAEFEENLGRDLRVQKLIAAITGPAPAPTEEQVKEFYQQNEAQMMMPDQVRARHILIRSPEADPQSLRADKRAKAEDLRKKLADGADFAALVREHSEDPGSVQRGGEYVFGRGQMVPPFEQAAFSQDINAIGPVVETAFGYHIIQVLARQQAHKQSIEEASPKIGQFLQHQARQRLLEQYITELRATAKIEFPTP